MARGRSVTKSSTRDHPRPDALESAERLLHTGSWEWDVETDTLLWSDNMYRLLGLEPGAIVPTPDFVVGRTHPEDRRRVAAEIEEARAHGGHPDVTYRVIWPDGTVHTLHGAAASLPENGDGEPSRLVGSVQDVTERERADHFRAAVMDTMLEGLYVLDAEGRVTFVNAAASRLLGWTEAELRGRSMHDTIHFQHADGSPHAEADCELRKVRNEGRSVRMEHEHFTRKNGSLFPVSYSAAPLMAGPKVDGVVVVFRDASLEHAEEDKAQRELDTLVWVGRIRDALDEDRMLLYSQPIVPLGDGGGEPSEELLLRMAGTNGEIYPPGTFLPVAERFGLIGEIDRWVIAEAIRLAATGRRIEANLSASSIGKLDLLALIEHELRETGADPAKVVFEITETALMENGEAGEAFARGLVETGCQVALDDFGTGFGGFTYLKTLPIKYLKIDIDFVRELPTNRANQHLVKAIVGLAKDFDFETIAEGVEDAETLTLLGGYGVDFAQGFHLGRPSLIAPSART